MFVYVCESVLVSTRALTTERIRAVYSLRNFNTKILNVRVCVHAGQYHFKRRNDMHAALAIDRTE